MGSGSVRGRLDADPAAGMLDLPVQDGEAPRLALAVGGRKSQSQHKNGLRQIGTQESWKSKTSSVFIHYH